MNSLIHYSRLIELTLSFWITTMESAHKKTICLLIEGVAGMYYSHVWPGVADCARENGYNLICYAGGSLRMSPQNPYEVQRNIIYSHIDIKSIDGLIISGTLKNFISDREFAHFMERFQGLPVVTLIPALENIPSVLIDNASGMKSLISHLVHEHGHRNFIFIGGPKGNLDADQRLDLFKKYMAEYGLEGGDDRVISGDFTRDGGYKAAMELLSKKIPFDAVLTANDETALGAIAAFREKGIRVPEDTAVTGFDGIEESELTTPPLTTVRQPLYEIGRSAVELLIARIKGKEVPLRTVLNAPLVVRQSCGCFINPKHALTGKSLPEVDKSGDIEQLRKSLLEALRTFEPEIASKVKDGDFEELVTAFYDEIEGKRIAVFLPSLNRIAITAVLSGEDTLQWQKIFVVMRKYTRPLTANQAEKADNLLHDGYNLFSEAAVRVQAHKRLQEEQQAALMRSAGHSIANSFDIPNLIQAVGRVFPNIGINDFYLSLYDKSTKEFLNSKLLFSLQRGKKSISTSDTFFPTDELMPGGIKPSSTPFQMVVQPLFFKNEQLGMAVFKNGPSKGYIYEILSEHLSGALQGALLMKKVQEQAITLEQTNQQLQKLREQEHAYLEAIKRELEMGRIIQASFLPESMPVIEGWESRELFMPAREVSGDFYDAFMLEDGRVAFVIADVSGKDVGAALFMSLIRTLVRAFSEQSLEGAADPLNAISLTNRYIALHHHSGKSRFMYVTMFFALVDPKTGEVTYINAGHNPPALLSSEGKIMRWLDPTGPAVGIAAELEFHQEKLHLDPGQMLLLYTDGVIEARNEQSEFFTRKRFAELIEQPYSSASEVVERVKNAIKEHSAGAVPYDDVTMLGIFRN